MMKWADGKIRCCWANPRNERYICYHDEEWGIPVHDDRKLFEMLILECFQAGLSWECVLNKRDAFRVAFDNFDPKKVSAYTEDKLEALRSNPGIIRNRLKKSITSTNGKYHTEPSAEALKDFDRRLSVQDTKDRPVFDALIAYSRSSTSQRIHDQDIIEGFTKFLLTDFRQDAGHIFFPFHAFRRKR